ncbi:hypothetical protein LZ335_07375 [Serratia marcescens]|uniref:hypothetical protein n=2 Tax=Serratia marcescens TaxID=615 RepID=UPI001F062542|nr:hypothetical protein [Serratia marcescens]MDM1846849.1 hypothetical protein [Serratia marcescens]UMK46429.1 hypothetical protein L2D51_15370 [Serratia marcescens]BEM14632.1 hypothetical protein SM14VA7_24580 [Serratia marcescens]
MTEDNEISQNETTPEVASETTPVVKARKPRKKATKPKRDFPQYSLEDCRKIADCLKEFNAGNPWAPGEVAKALGLGKGPNFFYMTASARDYGITVGTRDTSKIELTELGKSLVYPKSQEEEGNAILSSFLNIDLFKKVYDYYQGGNLPEIEYLKNTLKTEFGIDDQLQDDFYNLYQQNLKYVREKVAREDSISTNSVNDKTATASSSIMLGESQGQSKLIAFVAMPFSEKTSNYPHGYFDEVLKHLITPSAVKAGFNAKTAKKAGSEVIQSTIVNDLDAADLVIVDLTEHNPNVLFELGMRIAFSKPVCLIRAKGTAPIFDIDHMLRVYDYNPCLWPSTLESDIPQLSEHIKETWINRRERSYLDILRENKS